MSLENQITNLPFPMGKDGIKITSKVIIREIIINDPNSHYSYRELGDIMPIRISKERVRQLVDEISDEGLIYVSKAVFGADLHKEEDSLRAQRREKRKYTESTVQDMLRLGYHEREVETMMAQEGERPMYVRSVVNRLRNNELVALTRNSPRSSMEMAASDARVRDLFDLGLTRRQIAADVGLSNRQVGNSIRRLRLAGKIGAGKLGTIEE